jgi:CBS domain containing-hemolysin-like protein
MTVTFLLLAIVLIVLCGVFVAAEFSLLAVNRSSVERRANEGDKRSQGVLQALRTLSTQLSGAQVGITITNLAIGFLAQPAIASVIESPLRSISVPAEGVPALALVIGLIIATAATMIFGELLPKNIAIAHPLATARGVQGIQRFFSSLMKYPIRFLNGNANYVLRRMGVEIQEELASARSAEELSSLVRRSADKGTLSADTALMLERSLIFDELNAEDVMTPRIRMKTVSASDPANVVIEMAKTTGLSRFPVVGKNLDDITGIAHIKNALSVPVKKRSVTPVSSIMRPPIMVPSSVPLDSLLDVLRGGSGHQMAVVVDEYGGTDGLVTMEDLLEELVGEVYDEHDSGEPSVKKRAEGLWIFSGLLRPDEIAQQLSMTLPGTDEDEYETLGGLIADRLERIPKVGDVVELVARDREHKTYAVLLTVEKMDGRRVDRVSVELHELTDHAEQGDTA